jgi:hypothetical protein
MEAWCLASGEEELGGSGVGILSVLIGGFGRDAAGLIRFQILK